MSRFIYPVNLLSKSTELKFKELSYKNYKDINKMIVNRDDPCTVYFIDELIKELCIDNIDISTLTVLDKFYILIFLYGVNFSTTVQFNLTCPTTQKKFNYTLDLGKLLLKLDKLPIEHTKMIQIGETFNSFSLPTQFLKTKPLEELIASSFRGFWSGKRRIGEVSLNLSPKNVSYLPISVVRQYQDWLYKQEKTLNSLDFLGVQSPHVKEPMIIRFVPSLLDNTLLEFAKSLYQDDLKSIYLTEYHFVHNLGFTPNSFNDITPGEIAIYNGVEAKKDEKPPALPSRPPV